ncbi:MAG: hypothetical protein RR047_02570 [Bacilli bacterium]
MEVLNMVLPIVLYLLGAFLMVVLIILGIKLIGIADRANLLMDDLESKAKSLNGFFHIIDTMTDTLSFISDKFVNGLTSIITGLFHNNSNKRKKEREDYE